MAKPTIPYGTILFGKDGKVKPNIELLGDTTKSQEAGIGQKLITNSGLNLGYRVIVLNDDDHDLYFEPEDHRPIVMQCAEIVYRDFLLPADKDSLEHVVFEGKTLPIDVEKRDLIVAERIKEKLAKNYAKPTNAEFVLLIWSVTGYPFPIRRACDLLVEVGSGPFDRILLFDLTTLARQIWPIDENMIAQDPKQPGPRQGAIFIPAREMRVATIKKV